MLTHSLIDEKGYVAQINCELVLSDGNILLAGEDSLIKIVNKNKESNNESCGELYLEKIKNDDGYLVNIEDCKEFENGDIVCVCTDGDIALYRKENSNNINYTLIKINTENYPNIKKDCIYYLEIIDANTFKCWGESGEIYFLKKN